MYPINLNTNVNLFTSKIIGAHITLLYYGGFSYLMLGRYLDAARVLNSALVRAGVGWNPGVLGHATIEAGVSSPAGYALLTGRPVASQGAGSSPSSTKSSASGRRKSQVAPLTEKSWASRSKA